MLTVVTPYAGDPLFTLAELKAHLREEQEETANDDNIAALAAVAVEMIEVEVQRAYGLRTLEWVLPGLWGCMRLPIASVKDVVKIEYTALSGEILTLDPASYVVVPSGQTLAIGPRLSFVFPAIGQGPAPATVTFRAGERPMPLRVRQAVKLLLGHLYDNREAVVANATNMGELPMGVEAMISSERWS